MVKSVFESILYGLFFVVLLAAIAHSASAALTVNLTSPANYYNSTSSSVVFTGKAVTNETLRDCSLWTDVSGAFAQTAINTTVLNNTQFTFNMTGIADSVYNYATRWYRWTFYCNDNSTLSNGTSQYFSVNAVDETSPNITSVIAPTVPTGGIQSTDDITFNVSVVDDLSGVSSCTLWTSRSGSMAAETGSNISFSNTLSASYQYTISNMTDGNYSWYVKCNDNSSNTGTSATQNLFLDYVNDAPVFSPAIVSWNPLVGKANYYDVNATDSNYGDTITYTLNDYSKVLLDTATGLITYSPNVIESFNLTVFACDNHNLCLNQTLPVSSRQVVNSMTVSSSVTVGTDRNSTESTTFTVTNTGDEALGSINITSNAASSYNVKFAYTGYTAASSAYITSLAAHDSKQITVYVDIPSSASSGSTSLGSITVTSDKAAAVSSTLNMNVDSKLSFDKIKITGTNLDSSDFDSLEGSNNGTISPIQPGDSITVSVDVESMFDSDLEIDISDITVSISIDNMDEDEGTLEWESSSFDLKGEEVKRGVKMNFTVPYSVEDDGYYDIEITVEGKDDNKAKQKLEWNGRFSAERTKHSIVILGASSSKDTMSMCNPLTGSASVNIMNLGQQDEEDIIVKVWNTALGISKTMLFDEMSADYGDDTNTNTATFNLELPKTAKSGLYTFNVETYYKMDRLSKTGSFSIKVDPCTQVADTAATSSQQTTSTTSTSAATGTMPALTSSGLTSSGSSALQMLSTSGTSGNFVTSAIKRQGLFGADTISELPPYGIALILGNVIVGVSILVLIIKALFFRPRLPGFDI